MESLAGEEAARNQWTPLWGNPLRGPKGNQCTNWTPLWGNPLWGPGSCVSTPDQSPSYTGAQQHHTDTGGNSTCSTRASSCGWRGGWSRGPSSSPREQPGDDMDTDTDNGLDPSNPGVPPDGLEDPVYGLCTKQDCVSCETNEFTAPLPNNRLCTDNLCPTIHWHRKTSDCKYVKTKNFTYNFSRKL